jgi:hypothetical protein
MIPILIITNIITLSGFVFLLIRKIAVNKKIKDLKKLPSLKMGFYRIPYSRGDAIIWIKELDRYNNGFSKIELIKVEPPNSDLSYVKDYIKGNFQTIKRTSDIEWCDSVNQIKEERKHKLEQISKLNSKFL